MDKIAKMKQLSEQLNQASRAYYQEDRQDMSDMQYDALYDELVALEKETGIILSNSPSQKVGHEVVSALPKVAHKTRMLSLDKTKELDALPDFLGENQGLLSWKMDGLTVVLTYENGLLVQALTRGNGEIGEDITHNARCFQNIPVAVSEKRTFSVRGEAIITFTEFSRINQALPDELKYKNPRNLTSGTVRQLDSAEALKRRALFFAFSVACEDETAFGNSKAETLTRLEALGFTVVESVLVDGGSVVAAAERFKAAIPSNDFATDGLVLTFDDIAYSKSLGTTAKFPRDSIALKWADELAETVLRDIEWNTSRTGLINPIAIFDEVELEGTTVSRASVHNVSIMRELQLGQDDRLLVYKANMIIPQVYENLTKSGTLAPPEFCPACGGATEIRRLKEQEALYCTNEACIAKNISFLEHFVSRNAMNIEGLSGSTLEKLVGRGFIRSYVDIYRLRQHYDEMKLMEGFGEKSVQKLDAAIEKSKQVRLHNFIFALGIGNVGLANAKLLCAHFAYDLDSMMAATQEELAQIKGFGEMIAQSLTQYFAQEAHRARIDEIRAILHFAPEQSAPDAQQASLQGLTAVITGDLKHFANRKELQEKIETLGGKVTGSVTGKTTVLINNDVHSASAKNKKAKQLGVEILSEEAFMQRFLSIDI